MENEPKPTLNSDSDQYVGDKVADSLQGNAPKDETKIRSIDERHPIPKVPEHPAGAE